jgi:hypothetical protein
MWRTILEKLITIALLAPFAAAAGRSVHAEEGCPTGRFPQFLDNECVPISQHNVLPLTDNAPMRFEALQVSMRAIWIQATGTITKDTPAQFKKFLQTDDAKLTKDIWLHSPGGDLMAGLEVGQMIREAGMNTSIGHTVPLEGLMNIYSYKHAYCVSACAYAFLGGVTRSYENYDTHGIHRFGAGSGTISRDGAQAISGIVAKYVSSMGVDLSVFELASTASFDKDIYRVPVATAKRMRVIYGPT